MLHQVPPLKHVTAHTAPRSEPTACGSVVNQSCSHWSTGQVEHVRSVSLTCTSCHVLQEVQQDEAWAEAEAAPGPLPVRNVLQDDVAAGVLAGCF